MNKQPKAQEILFRMAVDHLTPRQHTIWDMWNYDRLTQDEIAKRLNMKRQNVAASIAAIEERIKKFIKLNMGAYLLLKLEYQIMNEEAE